MRVSQIAFVWLVLVAICSAQQDAPQSKALRGGPPKVWAIIGDPVVEESGLIDLLTARLSADGLELVERQEIKRIAEEQSIGVMLGTDDPAGRLKTGSLLGAEALILLSREEVNEKKSLQIVICECRFGSRLLHSLLSFDEGSIAAVSKQCAMKVRETRTRFKDGIQQIIGVAPLQSRNLSHRFDRYQRGFQRLIQSGLMQHNGVAAIEIDEARMIRQELVRGGRPKIDSGVVKLLDGEFEAADQNGQSLIGLQLRVQDMDRTSQFEVEPKTLDAMTEYLSTELIGRLVDDEEPDSTVKFDASGQFAWLARRAESFSVRGDWQESIALREAAVLLRPGNVTQRRKIIREILRFCRLAAADTQGSIRLSDQDPRFAMLMREKLRAFLSYLDHLEYLIRNRKISANEVISLTRTGGTHFMAQPQLEQYRQLRKSELAKLVNEIEADFFRTVTGPVLSLEREYSHNVVNPQLINFRGIRNDNQLKLAWFELYYLSLQFRLTGYVHSVEDLQRFEQFLVHVYPDGLPISDQMFSSFGQLWQLDDRGSRFYKHMPHAATVEQVRDFINRLVNSNHRTASLLGKYALFAHGFNSLRRSALKRGHGFQINWGKDLSPSQLATARQLLADGKALMHEYENLPYCDATPQLQRKEELGWSLLEHGCQQLSAIVGSANMISVEPEVAPGVLQLDLRGANGRVRVKQLNLNLKIDAGLIQNGRAAYHEVADHRMVHPENRLYLQSCGSVDVWWNPRFLLVMRKKGLLEQVPSSVTGKEYSDVYWDGENIWVASLDRGIQILDSQSLTFSRTCGTEQGLPGFERSLLLTAIEPGFVVAAGSFGKNGRAWLATVQKQHGRLQPDVIFEAAEVPDFPYLPMKEDGDRFVFDPSWMAKFPSNEQSAEVLVGRGAYERSGFLEMRPPLLVDVRSGKSKALETRPRFLMHSSGPPNHAYFHGRDRSLVILRGAVQVQTNSSSAKQEGRRTSKMICDIYQGVRRANSSFGGHIQQNSFIKWGRKLVVPGQQFYVVDPETLDEERYIGIEDSGLVDVRGFYGKSAHYGMVGWDGLRPGRFEMDAYELIEGGVPPKSTERFTDVESAISGAFDLVDGMEGLVRFEIGSVDTQKRYWMLDVGGETGHRPQLKVKVDVVVADELMEKFSISQPQQLAGKRVAVSGTAIRQIAYLNPGTDDEQVQLLLDNGTKVYKTGTGDRYYYYYAMIKVDSIRNVWPANEAE